jgi:hypothetical protein
MTRNRSTPEPRKREPRGQRAFAAGRSAFLFAICTPREKAGANPASHPQCIPALAGRVRPAAQGCAAAPDCSSASMRFFV